MSSIIMACLNAAPVSCVSCCALLPRRSKGVVPTHVDTRCAGADLSGMQFTPAAELQAAAAAVAAAAAAAAQQDDGHAQMPDDAADVGPVDPAAAAAAVVAAAAGAAAAQGVQQQRQLGPSGAGPLAVAAAQDEQLPRAADMGATRFDQLAVRVSNYPNYLYCHLGCCEHLVQVRDVRLVHASDPQRVSEYPVQLLQMRAAGVTRSARRCEVCMSNSAEFVVYDDPLGPGNPAFYCDRCKRLLHGGDVPPPGAVVFPYSIHQPVRLPVGLVEAGAPAAANGPRARGGQGSGRG